MDLGSPITILGMMVVVVLIIVFDKMIEGAFSGTIKAIFTGWLNWLVIIIILLLIIANGGIW